MKKIIALLLAALMIVSLAACGGTTTAPETTEAPAETEAAPAESKEETEAETTEAETEDPYADCDKEIVVGIAADPEQLIPWGGFSQGGRNIFPMIYQTLLSDVRDPETGDIVHYHALMESYEQIDDTHYEIKIYKGIKDTAGNDFTAHDVVYSFDGYLAGPAAAKIAKIVGYEATDDYTVKVEVAEGTTLPDFEDMLTVPNMVTKAAYEASPDGMAIDPVGTTGYVLKEYVPGSYVVVTKMDGEYWNQAANDTKDVDAGYIPTSDNTNVKTVRFEIITDQNTMAIALESGEIDINTNVSTTDVPIYQADDNYSVHQYPDNMFGLIFNCSDNSEFSNINLRKAVAYSISAKDLLDMIYDGNGFELKAFAMDYQIGFQKEWLDRDYFKQNKDEAKKYFEAYLKESGKKAEDLSFSLIHMSTDPMTKYAQVVQAAIIELTGNPNSCSLTSYDSVTYGTMRQDPTAFDLAILNSLSNKTYIFLNWQDGFDGNRSTYNNDVCHTGDKKLWELEEKAQSEMTDEAIKAFQDYLDENVYFVNYICGPAYWAGSSIVKQWALGAKNSVAVCAMDFDWSVKY